MRHALMRTMRRWLRKPPESVQDPAQQQHLCGPYCTSGPPRVNDSCQVSIMTNAAGIPSRSGRQTTNVTMAPGEPGGGPSPSPAGASFSYGTGVGSRGLAITTQALGAGLLVVGAVLVYVMISIWPAVADAAAMGRDAGTATRTRLFGLVELRLVSDSALLLLVVVASALGSYIHAATSFATYVGNRALALSWVWWYLLRVFIGVSLSVLFYLAIRGGFLAAQAESSDVNPYGIAALAGLVGLFSKQATDKLEEVFTTLFRVQERKGDALRKDKAALPRPTLVGIEPRTVSRHATASLRLLGDGFAPESAVRVRRVTDGRSEVVADQRVTSDTTVELTIDARFLDEPGQLELMVVNPSPGGGSSNVMLVAVEDVEPKATNGANRTVSGLGRFWQRRKPNPPASGQQPR